MTEAIGSGGLAQTTTNTWDTLGDELTTQDANGTTSMGYNLVGQMTSLMDPDQNQTVFTRDNMGRVISEQNPSGTETFAYDSNSKLIQQVDFDGHERDFVFDDLNRETAEKWMSGGTAINTISTAFNADGQVTSTGDNYSEYAFAFNGQGNQTSVDNAGTPNAPHVVLNSVFDAQGERTSLAATINGTADFINSYGYDALSRLNQIDQQGQSGGNAVSQKSIYVGYDGVGDITQLDYSNMVSQGPQQNGPGYATLSYSPTTGLLTGINDVANGTSIDNLAYTYDPLARVSTFTSMDGTATYGYDHTSQLVSATYTTASGGHQPNNVSFTWDANGNNAAPGNVVSPNNEVTNDGTFTYTFDANGNRTSRTRISDSYASDYKTTYTWDYRNRLTDVETFDNNGVLTKHVHLVYDVYDNLIEEDIDPNGGGTYTTVEQFALDVVAQAPSAGNAPLETFDASGNLDPAMPDDVILEVVNGVLAQRFLNGPSPSGADVIYAEGAVTSLTQPDVVDWLFVNNQGSPTDVVNSSGTLIDHQVYSPFGQTVYVSNAGIFVLQGFSGGIYDPNTGLIKFGERWYDPEAMVWLSADPAGFAAGGTNLATYASNAPSDFTDPSGEKVYWAVRDLDGVFVGNHGFILIVPDDPSDFADDPLMVSLYKARRGTTLAAYTEDKQGWDECHRLEPRRNYKADIAATLEYLDAQRYHDRGEKDNRYYKSGWDTEVHEVTPPTGMSDTQFIRRLLMLFNNYGHQRRERWPEYALRHENCQAFVNSLLKSAGISDEERAQLSDFSGVDEGEDVTIDADLFDAPPDTAGSGE